jgi:hypothetical protein
MAVTTLAETARLNAVLWSYASLPASNSHPPKASDADAARLVSAITNANDDAAALAGMTRAIKSS